MTSRLPSYQFAKSIPVIDQSNINIGLVAKYLRQLADGIESGVQYDMTKLPNILRSYSEHLNVAVSDRVIAQCEKAEEKRRGQAGNV